MSNLLPIVVAKNKEVLSSWEGITTPHDFLLYLARMASVDPSSLASLEEIVFSDVQPTGESGKKIWIKTGSPCGIGIPVGSLYNMIYQYPVGVPMLWKKSNNLPSYLKDVSQGVLEDMGLVNTELYKYVIFNP